MHEEHTARARLQRRGKLLKCMQIFTFFLPQANSADHRYKIDIACLKQLITVRKGALINAAAPRPLAYC
jgi:hypothetical protein